MFPPESDVKHPLVVVVEVSPMRGVGFLVSVENPLGIRRDQVCTKYS